MDTSETDFLMHIDAAITVCDRDFTVLYMNEKAARSFEAEGGRDLVGKSLVACHKPESVGKMKKILEGGIPNVYTISKKGVKKLIWQAPWTKDGEIAGLVELSIPLPETMPHYERD